MKDHCINEVCIGQSTPDIVVHENKEVEIPLFVDLDAQMKSIAALIDLQVPAYVPILQMHQ